MSELFTKAPWALPLLAYLIGSVPFGLLIGRALGRDLRREGSGNIGATNAARVLGKGWGLLTLFCDLMKGFAPVLAAKALGLPLALAGLAGLAAVFGHTFSLFLGLRGGKGVATGAGVYMALAPQAFLVGAAVFAAVARATRYVSLGSLSAAAVAPVAAHFLGPGPEAEPFFWAIGALVWWSHRSNLKRLREGRELRFGGP